MSKIPQVYREKYKIALETWPSEKMLLLRVYWIIMHSVERYAMWPDHHEILMEYVGRCDGDHLEIGTLWGGSAIAAHFAKPHGEIYCIDPCNFNDVFVEQIVTENAVRANFAKFGFKHHLYVAKHPPMPPGLADRRFDTALIDGSHTLQAVKANWKDVKDRIDQYVIFHDIHMGGIRPVFRKACQDPDWKLVKKLERIGVLKKR